MASPGRSVRVGRIVGVYGVQGWVKLESWTEPRMRIFDYQPWQLTAPGIDQEVRNVEGRQQGKGIVARLPGIDDREGAAALMGTEITVSRELLPAPAPGEYYWTDLEGLEVVTIDDVPLGQVSHLFATGANDVMVVRSADKERLIPFVQGSYVRTVDIPAGRMVVDWDPEF